VQLRTLEHKLRPTRSHDVTARQQPILNCTAHRLGRAVCHARGFLQHDIVFRKFDNVHGTMIMESRRFAQYPRAQFWGIFGYTTREMSPSHPQYRDISYWLESAGDDLTPRAPLGSLQEADVAILGAGFTGLWTAYYLLRRDPTLRVVILEKEIAGFG